MISRSVRLAGVVRLARWLTVVAVTAIASVIWPGVAAQAAPGQVFAPGLLRLQVVPPLSGVVVTVDGATARSNGKGLITVRVNNFVGLESRITVPETQVASDRRVAFDRFRGDLSGAARGKVIEMGVRTSRLVSWQFVDRFGNEFPTDRVESMRLRSSTGEVVNLTGAKVSDPLWVAESRTQQTPNGLLSKQLYYVVDSAFVDGALVVHRAQQRFVPWVQRQWRVQLLFFQVSFTASDLLFTNQVGTGVEIIGPDGTVDRVPFGPDGVASVANVPRGTYQVKVYGGGLSFARPVSISKDQQVALNVISWVDLAAIFLLLLGTAIGLIFLGRPHLFGRSNEFLRWMLGCGLLFVPRLPLRSLSELFFAWGRSRLFAWTRSRRAATPVVLCLAVLAAITPVWRATAASANPQHRAVSASDPVPVLAHYYIWFNPTSWNRAKIDYPLLGRYSSDDSEIMRRHVRMAKAAGITGFLVSWKHTTQLDARLAKLTEVARAEKFRLGMVYQGLDFERKPLPLATVKADLELFAERYGGDPVFDIFGKPVVVWTGSSLQSRESIEATLAGVRDRLMVLGNAKNVEDVVAMGPAVEGQAYYWSSVDPVATATGPKLAAMSSAVHLNGGLWLAPVAPGFDARLVGGAKDVPRRAGDTLRASFMAARESNPDALAVISWNEFSENTHIEPSQRYGSTDLAVLAALLGADTQLDVPTDSSDTTVQHHGLTGWGALLLAGTGLLLMPAALAAVRRRRKALTRMTTHNSLPTLR